MPSPAAPSDATHALRMHSGCCASALVHASLRRETCSAPCRRHLLLRGEQKAEKEAGTHLLGWVATLQCLAACTSHNNLHADAGSDKLSNYRLQREEERRSSLQKEAAAAPKVLEVRRQSSTGGPPRERGSRGGSRGNRGVSLQKISLNETIVVFVIRKRLDILERRSWQGYPAVTKPPSKR